MGVILLEGGAEFGGQMAVPDQRAMVLAGGKDAPIRIIPAAAAPDNNHHQAGENGVSWFKRLGATNVATLPLIDSTSADDLRIAEALSKTRLIYLLGGFPRHLGQTLSGSRCWQAILSAYRTGAVIAGSSAGAMVLCDYYYDPSTSQVMDGLKFVNGMCILPHHNAFGKDWVPRLRKNLPKLVLVGIDEETGCINADTQKSWQVHGKGKVTLYYKNHIKELGPEQEFILPLQ